MSKDHAAMSKNDEELAYPTGYDLRPKMLSMAPAVTAAGLLLVAFVTVWSSITTGSTTGTPFPSVVSEACAHDASGSVELAYEGNPMRCSVLDADACGGTARGRCIAVADAYVGAGWSTVARDLMCFSLAFVAATASDASDGLCVCEEGVDGPSCQGCALGFWRSQDGASCVARPIVQRRSLLKFSAAQAEVMLGVQARIVERITDLDSDLMSSSLYGGVAYLHWTGGLQRPSSSTCPNVDSNSAHAIGTSIRFSSFHRVLYAYWENFIVDEIRESQAFDETTGVPYLPVFDPKLGETVAALLPAIAQTGCKLRNLADIVHIVGIPVVQSEEEFVGLADFAAAADQVQLIHDLVRCWMVSVGYASSFHTPIPDAQRCYDGSIDWGCPADVAYVEEGIADDTALMLNVHNYIDVLNEKWMLRNGRDKACASTFGGLEGQCVATDPNSRFRLAWADSCSHPSVALRFEYDFASRGDASTSANEPLLPLPASTDASQCTAATTARADPTEKGDSRIVSKVRTFTGEDVTAQCPWAGDSRSIANIHVGKTGGEAFMVMAAAAGIEPELTEVHEWSNGFDPACGPESCAQAAVECRFSLYLVMTRDPVARTISAFNFDCSMPVPASHNPATRKLCQECFPWAGVPGVGGLQAFATALDEESECGALARASLHEPAVMGKNHLAKGHAYYLRDTGLLEVLRRSDKHVFVVRTENFEEDARGAMEWLCVPPERVIIPPSEHTEYERMNDTTLTDAARATLRAHLSEEYYAKEIVEGLSINLGPSAPGGGAWARPPALAEAERACTAACSTPDAPPSRSVNTAAFYTNVSFFLFPVGVFIGVVGTLIGTLSGARRRLKACWPYAHERMSD